MVKYTGVNHLAMATGDIDSTIKFWRDLLGMRLVAGLGEPGYRHYFFEISDSDMIAFFEWPGIKPIAEKEHGRPVSGPYVFDHVSFGVETEDALWELKDRISTAGFWVSEMINHGFIHSIYSYDPNGIAIEFSVNVVGRDIRKNPIMADKEPSSITLEGSESQVGRWPAVTKPTPPSERKVFPGAGSELYHRKNKWK